MRNVRLILILLGFFSFVVTAVQAGEKLLADFVRGRVYFKAVSMFELKPGEFDLEAEASILTFFDGQCFLKNNENSQFRMKEDSMIRFLDADRLEIRKGTVGVKSLEKEVSVIFGNFELKVKGATVVVKATPVLTRVCVVNGRALIRRKGSNEETVILSGKEVAFATGKVSKMYPFTDELRYTWYWVDAVKEPALMPEFR